VTARRRTDRYRWIVFAVTLSLLAAVLAIRATLLDRAPAQGRSFGQTAIPAAAQEPPTRYRAAKRVVAIGDLHGDLASARAALRLAGAIDDRDRWAGGDLVVVQTGDAVDRGDDDRPVVDLLARLEIEAAEAGGAFRPLIGNHELMNAEGIFRFVSARGLGAFDDLVPGFSGRPELARFPAAQRGRAAAFSPGGPIAAIFARRNVAAIVGDTLFVHGGILPAHVAYGRERINREARAYLRGALATEPAIFEPPDSPVWTRLYSLDREPSPVTCLTLEGVLAALGAARMVVGHTVQSGGITSACGGRVWRIDTGMSAAYEGGPVSALEIVGSAVAPISRLP
jgi:hypothetical protein